MSKSLVFAIMTSQKLARATFRESSQLRKGFPSRTYWKMVGEAQQRTDGLGMRASFSSEDKKSRRGRLDIDGRVKRFFISEFARDAFSSTSLLARGFAT